MKVDIRIAERYENKCHPVFDYLKYTLDDQKLDGGISGLIEVLSRRK